MKWMVSVVMMLGLFLWSGESKAFNPPPQVPPPYPWEIDPCSEMTGGSCVPVDSPNQLFWVVFNNNSSITWNFDNFSLINNSYEYVTNQILEAVRTEKNCNTCILITQEVYESVYYHNAAQPIRNISITFGFENETSNQLSDDLMVTTQYGHNNYYVSVGRVEDYYSNGNHYKAIRYFTSSQFAVHKASGYHPTHWAIHAAICENDTKVYPKAVRREVNGEGLYRHYCSYPNEPVNTMSGLDALTEGCTYGCNPVHLATGSKLDYKRDYQNYSPYPITVDRWYNSKNGSWIFSFDRKLKIASFYGGQTAALFRPDGATVKFTRLSSNSSWSAQHPTILGTFSSNMSSLTERYSYQNLHGETEFYNEQGRLTKIQSRDGSVHTYTYGPTGLLSTISDDFGREIEISYTFKNGKQVLWKVSDGDKTITYNIEPTVYMTKHIDVLEDVVYPDGKIVSYVYDEDTKYKPGILKHIIGEDGEIQASYEYDAQNRVTASWKGPVGPANEQANKISYEYQTAFNSNQTSTAITTGTSSAFAYNDPATNKTTGSPKMCLGCSGSDLLSATYHSDGSVAQKRNKDGSLTSRGPSQRGLPNSETFFSGTAQQYTVNYTWNYEQRLPLTIVEPVVKAGGTATRTTTFAYDSNHRLTSKTIAVSDSPTQRTESWTYNALGNVLTYTNPVTGTTTYTYDTQGNLLTKVNSMGHTWNYSNYTLAGLVQRVIDPNGLYIETTYDQRDRVTQVRRGHPDEHWETTILEYNDLGLVVKITHPDGQWNQYTYDKAQQIVEETTLHGKTIYDRSPDGDVMAKTSYDTNNNVVKLEEYEYDAMRRLSKVINAYNQFTQLTYDNPDQDKLHNISDIDNQGDKRYITYDSQGRQTGVNGSVQNYGNSTYDQHGQQTKFTDPHLVATTFNYNSWGEIISQHSGDYGTTNYIVDAATGLTKIEMNSRNVWIDTMHDDLGRPTRIEITPNDHPTHMETEFRGYFWDIGINGIGRITGTKDNTGNTSYVHDRFGRVTLKSYLAQGSPVILVTGYTYNNLGQLVSQQYPSGRVVNYQYTNGRVSNIEYDFQPVATNITWTPSGQVKGFDHLTGTDVKFFYDGNGNVQRIEDLDDRTYTRSPSGKILSITDAFDSTADQFFTYQPNKSLKQVNLAARTQPIDLTHNENNSLIVKSVDVGWDDDYRGNHWQQRENSNRPGTITEGFSFSYTMDFDAGGNLLDNKDGLTLIYDQSNRMSGSNRMGIVATYGVNMLGQRVRKSGSHLSTGHRYYAYDEESRLIGVYDGTGAAIEEFIYLDGYRVIASARNISTMSSTPELYAVYSDHLGTPRKVTNSVGMLLWSWDSKDPYGHQAPNEFHTGTTFEFDLRFPGQIFDNETGLYHNGFRDYDPKRGAYVQPDPIGLAGGMNPYSYAGGDPINFSDPTGLIIDYGTGENERIARSTVEYLRSKSPTAKKYIEEIEQDPRTLTLRATRDRNENGSYLNNVATWNVDLHLMCDTSKQLTATPELLLFHEMYHFLLDTRLSQNYHRWRNKRVFGQEDKKRWTHSEEKSIIEGPERKVGAELGLKQYRRSHSIDFPQAPQKRIFIGNTR